MLTRFSEFPLDARNIRVFSKAIALGVVVLIVDRRLRTLGAGRLLIDAALYVAVAFAIGVVRVQELGLVIRLLRHRGPGTSAAPVTEIPP
jgi:hypothetical protein